MGNLPDLIQGYGSWIYVALFLYCVLKSGSLPLFAGYAVQAQLLELPVVLVATFAGGYLGDEARFFAARRYGISWLTRWPITQKPLAVSNALIERHGVAYIFVYRYPKGMRTIGALPVGLGPMSWGVFTVCNAASALIWTVCLVMVGYLFGKQVEQVALAGWASASAILLVVMIAFIVFAWWHMNRPRRASHKADAV
jgi:membrane-associated protein